MKYGILGIGQAGLRHFEAFKKIKNLKLIGFIENNLSKAKSFEKKFKAKHCKKLKDLLLLKPSFIVLSLPHNQRAIPIIACIKKDINLLIEKPLATDPVELKKILPYLNKKKLTHSISFVHRYRKEVLKTNELIQTNKIGKIKFISEMMISQKSSQLPKWIDNKNMSGGGVLIYNAIHSIDKLVFFAKSKIVKVFSKYNNINNSLKVEDAICVILVFKNNVVANLVSVFAPYNVLPKWETKIFGEKGSIDLQIREGLTLKTNSGEQVYNFSKNYKKFGPNHNFFYQAQSYVNSLSKNKKPFVDVKDGIESVKIVNAIYKSIKLNKTINIS